MLVCTLGAAFGIDWWWFGAFQYILHTVLSVLACTACTDMEYSKELERDVTSSAMAQALLRLKTSALFLHRA